MSVIAILRQLGTTDARLLQEQPVVQQKVAEQYETPEPLFY